ncbi:MULTISPECIES: hypothetical protein [Pseudomonas]|uniref:Uncharacterized protein n=1 Tax=Pseudomonas neustonica TaxID=2487346 RepID=A0ABX9XHX6_9PSED|nr:MULTISPECIES: hypothetical protein [Pseudomonas]MAB25150.1 hypothetical protein [Pseudomonadales bacterium]MBA6421829.1 hypothetical protein [Pseudomonas sp. 5Ae-yellow]ROZ82770.1 hypothetical protein EF099_11145 [Pseudomonas sp. SSM44]ROZ84722.1 hypothetical protein EF096_10005 [Pseudomonas neustonica]
MERPEYVVQAEVARLIPVVADTNREQRAASIFLAALRGVYEFRQVMFASLGHRVSARARMGAWTEVALECDLDIPKKDRPDGLVQLVTGSKQWAALIEAKIGSNEVGEEQLKRYLLQAKKNKIDAVITITNQFVALPNHHPVKIPKTLLKGVELYHWSWMYAVTQATLLLDSGDITSPDQRFILEEVLRYFSHDSSGATRFDSMNREWKEVVAKVKSGAVLSKSTEEVENTVSSWHQEQRDLCLVMSRKLGRQIKQKISKSHRNDPVQRLKDDCELLAKEHKLTCCLTIPDAAADLDITADLTKRTITCAMRLGAPQDKVRSSARVNWLIKQVSKANADGFYVKAIRPGRAEETQTPLATLLADGNALETLSTNVVPSAFEVFYMADLGARFSGAKVFIEELEKAVPHFYQEVGQKLRAWVAPPPKLQKRDPVEVLSIEDSEEAEQAAIESTGD